MLFQVWLWPVHCRSVLGIEMSWISFQQMISVRLTLKLCKITAIKLLLLAKPYIHFLKEVRDCYRAFVFSLEAFICWMRLWIASSWLWKLSLHLVFRLDFKWGKELEKRHFVRKGLDCPVALPSKVTNLLKLTAWSRLSPSRGLEIFRCEDTELVWYHHDIFLCGEEDVIILFLSVR